MTSLESLVQALEEKSPAGGSTKTSRPNTTLDATARPRRRVGCCGWITLVAAGFVILGIIGGLIHDAVEPDLHVDGTTGTIIVNVIPTYTTKLVGTQIAQRVYEVATKHTELNRIMVNVEFNPALLVDKYGRSVKGPLHMGTVTVSDLSGVRRYEFDGAYMSDSKYGFADQVSRMNYAENLGM